MVKSLEIRNALIVTQNQGREVLRGNIYAEGERISYIGRETHNSDEIIDGTHKIVIPGLINTHCHVAMSHLRGKLDDMPLNKFLELTFKLDSERTNVGIYNSALLGIYEMIDSGVTSFVDLYYSEDLIAKAAKDAGMRAFLSWNTLDEDKTTQKGNPSANAERFIGQFQQDGLITPSIGVQGVYVASDEVYLKAKEIAERKDTIIHGHLGETREEVYNFMAQHNGERPTEHLDRIGFLNRRFLAAHGVWNTMREVRLMGKNHCNVSWNPVSNAKLGVGGIAPVTEYRDNGVTVTVGSDSSGSNNNQELFQTMKFGSIWVKNERWDPALTTAQEILDMATVNASRALNRNDIGSIEIGKKADFAILDMRTPRMMLTNEETAVSNIIYSADSSCVSDVIVNGKILKRDRKLVGYDPVKLQGETFI
ncbi:MAG: amidohydrolase family protein [Candidatus Thermoplasmatota archaeon]|nr:amidohydrolase family protein [Candidatus Thermoplasmatota archaeon]